MQKSLESPDLYLLSKNDSLHEQIIVLSSDFGFKMSFFSPFLGFLFLQLTKDTKNKNSSVKKTWKFLQMKTRSINKH